MSVDRAKELEKIAKKLGIGLNRKVKCIGCEKEISFKKAVALTDKEEVAYLCKKCLKRLKRGAFTQQQIDKSDILKELEKLRKEKVPILPWPPDTDVSPVRIPPPIPQDRWIEPYKVTWGTDRNIKLAGSALKNPEITKELYVLKNDNQTNPTTAN